ncbi:MAG: hypothetical protein P0Y56_09845 [Candidatus Andeanibacterium colombiense]|uniref:Porin domain-containing protein n=1 Tax=Candidatus Andeanibacterium colombiense TaxID=3121345 RepID=A0AAJ6BN68_9SPHN|nr:MAG: hypothetical protein P0Y56_09845 [Sphingomonadaceae bacterium]
MVEQRKSAWRGGAAVALLCAGAAVLVAAPSAVLALDASGAKMETAQPRVGLGHFTPASIDPKLARLLAERSGISGPQMRFTPAGGTSRAGRTITVAVRVDEGSSRLIAPHQDFAAADGAQTGLAALRLAPARYSLGTQRGYAGFAAPRALEITKPLSDAAIPDLSAFQPSPGAKDKPSRFNARIALEEQPKLGRDARSRESLGTQTVDVGGAFSITRNFDLTAGVRYSQDRDRLAPLTNGKQDSQAVYVGTQFSF